METTPYSKAQAGALYASLREPIKPGWVEDATISEAVERPSARGNMMIELSIVVRDGHGGERILKDYLTNTPLGALRLHSACEAVGALDRYNAGKISPDDFIGKIVRVKLSVERSRRYGQRNIIEEFAAAEVRIVSLRGVAS